MKNKNIFIVRLIYSIFITLLLFSFFYKTSNGKLILIPFLICSISLVLKNLFLLIDKGKYATIFNKMYTVGFLIFWFLFLIVLTITNIVNKEYIVLLFSIPFWLVGIYIIKKRVLKKSNKANIKNKSNINFKIVISSLLVGVVLLSGILMLFFGIKDTYKIKKETKNYITTNAYYKDYEIYDSTSDSVTYKLIYVYEVDNKKYTISTNYGTNYIPDKNSIREVKYNPENPFDAIFIGTNSNNILIYFGVFFILGSFTFVIFGLTIKGIFDKFKIDVIGAYIGFLFLIMGILVIQFQNGTTMSLTKTIKSFGLWVLIPIMFIIVGIYQIFKCLFINKKRII